MTTATRVRGLRKDALPEHSNYRDTGCDLYPSCLHCPLPRCRYEEPGGESAQLRALRDQAIAQQFPFVGADELVNTYGISKRSVYRIVQAARRAQ